MFSVILEFHGKTWRKDFLSEKIARYYFNAFCVNPPKSVKIVALSYGYNTEFLELFD